MKFGYAWTFVNKLRGGTPAPPPEKRTPALPRLPACRALSRQIGKCILRGFPIAPYLLPRGRTGNPMHNAPPGATGGTSTPIAPPHYPAPYAKPVQNGALPLLSPH